MASCRNRRRGGVLRHHWRARLELLHLPGDHAIPRFQAMSPTARRIVLATCAASQDRVRLVWAVNARPPQASTALLTSSAAAQWRR